MSPRAPSRGCSTREMQTRSGVGENQKISKGSHSRFVEGENEWLIKYLVFGKKIGS